MLERRYICRIDFSDAASNKSSNVAGLLAGGELSLLTTAEQVPGWWKCGNVRKTVWTRYSAST